MAKDSKSSVAKKKKPTGKAKKLVEKAKPEEKQDKRLTQLERRLEEAVATAEAAAKQAQKAAKRVAKHAKALAEEPVKHGRDVIPSRVAPAEEPAETRKPATTSAAALASRTRQDLLVLARERDIRGRNAMTKAELVAALR